jgi:hypothetical protein
VHLPFSMHDATFRDEKKKPATARRAGFVKSMSLALAERHLTRTRVRTRTHAGAAFAH